MRQPGFAVLASRPRLRALVLSGCCLLTGFAVFLVLLGMELETAGGTASVSFVLLVLLDAVIGVVASTAVGPLGRSRVGNLLVVAAAVVSTWAVPACVVSVVRIGARRSFALDTAVVGITALGAFGFTLLRDAATGRPSDDVFLVAAIAAAAAVIVLLWGRVRGTRAALVDALREQAASAEDAHQAVVRTREAEVARARAEERSAIARDMHDGISHQLAIVAMHAGALAYRTDLEPERQRAAADTVRDAAAGASGMLRDALTALRATDGESSRSPLPDAGSIDAIVGTARESGHVVDLEWVGLTASDLQRLPGRAPTFARILDELLLNARKYAPSQPVTVRIAREADGVLLRVGNPLSGAPTDATGTGLGLVGVSERASILGGTASYGPTSAGTFEVEVRLP